MRFVTKQIEELIPAVDMKNKTEEQIQDRKEYDRQRYLNRPGKHGGKDRKRCPPRQEVPCAICGTVLSLQPNQVRGNNYCGYECRNIAYTKRRAENSPRWKGGKRYNDAGYVEIRLQPDDPYYSMQSVRHYVLEHRLVMAKYLGRCLLPWEVVHHINGIKDDNRIENLKLLGGNGEHNTFLDKWCKKLLEENRKLKEEIRRLKADGSSCSI